jgi:hypothetical protein
MIAPANLSRITIPSLENGDLLSPAEFERRYIATLQAELISDHYPTTDKFVSPFHPPVLATQMKNDSLH